MMNISGQQFEKLKDVLNFVWKNPYSDFYTRKFMAAGIKPDDIKTPDDIQKIPFTTRDELVGDPFERLFVDKKEIGSVRSTSGTGGRGSILKFKAWDEVVGFHKIFDYSHKIERVLFLSPVSRVLVPYELYKRHKKTMVVGDFHDLPGSALIASKAKIDSVHASPTIAIVFAEYLKKTYDLGKISILDLVGEGLTIGMKKILRSTYPNAAIINNYGIVEIGYIGFQCPETIDEISNTYHIPTELFLCEIVEPETGRSCSSGELVLTWLEKAAMPTIRYRTGDIAEFSDYRCPCGSDWPMVRIIGRIKHDFVRLGGTDIYAEKIEEAVSSQHAFLTGAFQAHIYEETAGDAVKPRIVIDVVLRDALKGRGETLRKKIAERVSEGISRSLKISPRFTLAQAVEGGIFLPLEINFVDRIDVHGQKSRKLVDHRA